MKFTASQQDAIAFRGQNLQLVACAGSGKTEVVARRIVHLLTSPPAGGGLLPRSIVAFTFTDKAAAELKERIIARCRDALGDIPGLAEMFVGTVHAFSLELLKTETLKYLKYEVLNEVQQRLFVDRYSRQSGLTACADLDRAPLRRFRDTPRYLAALAILREASLVNSRLAGCCLMKGLQSYRSLMEDRSYLEYSGILEAAVDVLANEQDIRHRLAGCIRYVIVDEYQDLNPIQEAIVRLLHDLGAQLCVVGDDDQTIYQWRGSDVGNILTFATRYPAVTQITLGENFRSSEGVVETARALIEQNIDRLPKIMKSNGAQSYEPGDITALAFANPEAEAHTVVETARVLRGAVIRDNGRERGLSWSDMAVLLRSVRANGEPILRAFQSAHIPVVVVGMASLFRAPEAEASRRLFYFMADCAGVDEVAVKLAWRAADLGLESRPLHRAIADLVAAKKSLGESEQARWGVYSIQRVFLKFLEDAGVREERVPNGRGDVVFYNLGKFSQLITDFETIHYHSKPIEKYASFANFLQNQAEGAYPEGWQDNQYASPDAVRIMTVHQAKGMQWPVVFLPALIRNRFPARRPGGRSIWHMLPRAGIHGQERYEGSIDDERRLFYVAMTRSQKYLHMSWAPIPGNQQAQHASQFWMDLLASKWVTRYKPDYRGRRRMPPTPRAGVVNVVFTFSDLKYFFECPYQFKLRILYGFNAPVHEALGYGKSIHDVLAEVHARAVRGDIAAEREVAELVERHLHLRYAYPALREALEGAARRVLLDYLRDSRALLSKLQFSEKPIGISLGDGVTVNGRIDLVRRIDTGETTIVDLKSTEQSQTENITQMQLQIYALGYQELTGRRPDYVEAYVLERQKRKRYPIDDSLIAHVKSRLRNAAKALRQGALAADASEKKCTGCDYRGMCSEGSRVAPSR